MLNEVKSRSASEGTKIAFRMDDVGASTKQFEVYSKSLIGNFLVLKYFPPFKAWAPYNELSAKNWEEIINILDRTNSKITVAVTAAWVEKNGDLTPFPKKFPKQAAILKKALQSGLIEIANHGLTHCVVGQHLPRLFTSNRKYHREFLDFLSEEEIKNHLEKSQKILEDYFKTRVTTFTPPGNMYTKFTWEYAQKIGLKYLSVKEKNTFAFHDKDIILNGIQWLEKKINLFKSQGFQIVKVKEL